MSIGTTVTFGLSFRSRVCVALAAAVLTASSASSAQSTTSSIPPQALAERRLLIEQAQRAMRAGDHAGALRLATQAGNVLMTPSLRQLIAAEQHMLGQHVAALDSAALCVSETLADPTTPLRDRQLAACRAMVAEFERLVGRITLDIPQSVPPETRIRIGDESLPRALWSTPFSAMPGQIAIEVAAPRFQAIQRTVNVHAGESVTVPIQFVPVAGQPAMPVVHAQGGPVREPTPERAASPLRPLGVTALVLGGAVLVGGVAALAVQWTNAGVWNDDLMCSDPSRPQCKSAFTTAGVAAPFAATGLIAGGALAITGIALILAAPSQHNDHPTASMRARFNHCAVEIGTPGIACTASF
jgi:hypothetical protein